jgi:hypothetical protein
VIFEDGKDLFELSEKKLKRKNTDELISDAQELIENSAAFLDI